MDNEAMENGKDEGQEKQERKNIWPGAEILGRLELGEAGEFIAGEMLEAKGYTVIHQNYRCRIGEIDLIYVMDKLLVFGEVKCRKSLAFGIPAEAITPTKIRHIRRVASWYLARKMSIYRLYDDYDMRFDVIEVVFVGDEYMINHVENAFW